MRFMMPKREPDHLTADKSDNANELKDVRT